MGHRDEGGSRKSRTRVYNNNMGDADLADMLASSYRIDRIFDFFSF